MKKTKKFIWARQTMAREAQTIDLPPYDPIQDFHRDPSGYYVLIRPDFTAMKIEVALCNKAHVIVRVFRGRKAQDLYEGIFKEEKKQGMVWFMGKGHMAYLGKELKKAEWALVTGQNGYFQE